MENDDNGGTLLTDPKVVMQKAGNASATIASGDVLDINTPDKGKVIFAGSSGTLWLQQPSTFTGTVSGFKGADVIDLPGIAFGADTTLGYLPNSNQSGGTLSVTDGTVSANIALLGSYIASSFVMSSDSHGGTLLVAEALRGGHQSLLTSPQHA